MIKYENYTCVQLLALGSKSSIRTKCDKKCDSCMPTPTINENIADGWLRNNFKLTAKPAISSGNGRLRPHTQNQSITLEYISFNKFKEKSFKNKTVIPYHFLQLAFHTLIPLQMQQAILKLFLCIASKKDNLII